MNLSYPGLLRAPFLLFSRVYRIVERKCRIVKGLLVGLLDFLRRRILFFQWESMGQYQRGVGIGDVVWDVGEISAKGIRYRNHNGKIR